MTNTIWAKGVEEPEGPVWAEDGSLYIVEMSASRRGVSRVSADGRERTTVVQIGSPPERPGGGRRRSLLDRGGERRRRHLYRARRPGD